MPTRGTTLVAALVATLLAQAVALPRSGAATLEVGPGKPFRRIEDANAAARPGDLILVHALGTDQPYTNTAVLVRQARLTFRGVPGAASRWVKVSGKGFDYSGRGSTPRAIFQFEPGADSCTLEGFELADAHNDAGNGAGVRINQANHITIRHCAIHDNDMGIMSNGDGTLQRAVDQRIEHCAIYHNGSMLHPGFNHNLYLGGTSVALRFCDVHHSLTGHNVKSRAHHTRVEYCFVHDSANREFDLVDSTETAQPHSHAVLVGNVIAKSPNCQGNRTVIHFGQDGGKPHDGTLYLVFNTIVTPFIAPVVDLSARHAKAHLLGNLLWNGGMRQAGQKLVGVRDGALGRNVTGSHNWFCGDFGSIEGTGLDATSNRFGRVPGPLFVNPTQGDYRLLPQIARTAAVDLSVDQITLPRLPGAAGEPSDPPLVWQYHHPLGKQPRPHEPRLTLGAYAATTTNR